MFLLDLAESAYSCFLSPNGRLPPGLGPREEMGSAVFRAVCA